MTSLLAKTAFAASRHGVPGPCTLVDLTDHPRVGFRGAQAAQYLQDNGFELPQQPNQAVRQADGGYVLRLSATEYFLLGGPGDQGQRIATQEAAWTQDDRASYLLPRQDSHAWLQLRGASASAVLAKLCGVDLRAQAFAPLCVAQTSAARINVIVLNAETEGEATFHLLFDRCSHEYFQAALQDAMQEFLAT